MVGQGTNSGVRWSEFPFCHLINVQLWTNHLESLNWEFLVCKLRIVIAEQPYRVTVSTKWDELKSDLKVVKLYTNVNYL